MEWNVDDGQEINMKATAEDEFVVNKGMDLSASDDLEEEKALPKSGRQQSTTSVGEGAC